MSIGNGGPAFPLSGEMAISMAMGERPPGETEQEYIERRTEIASGMSLRDWFAGMVLPSVYSEFVGEFSFVSIAGEAYRCADAMLAERAKGGGQ